MQASERTMRLPKASGTERRPWRGVGWALGLALGLGALAAPMLLPSAVGRSYGEALPTATPRASPPATATPAVGTGSARQSTSSGPPNSWPVPVVNGTALPARPSVQISAPAASQSSVAPPATGGGVTSPPPATGGAITGPPPAPRVAPVAPAPLPLAPYAWPPARP